MYGLVLVYVWVVFSELNFVIISELVNLVGFGFGLFIVGKGFVIIKWFVFFNVFRCLRWVGCVVSCFFRLFVILVV